MSRPSTTTRPEVGRSSPLRCLASVVLPDPFCPTTATTDPGSIASDTASSATRAIGIREAEVIDRRRWAPRDGHRPDSSQARVSATVTGSSLRGRVDRPGECGDLRRSQAERRELVDRAEHLGRRSLQHDPTGVEHDDPVGEASQGLDVMLGDDDRHPCVPIEPVGDGEHVGRPGWIQVRRRLVHDQHPRLHREHGGDRHSLLLATRQGQRRALLEPDEPDRRQRAIDAARHLVGRHRQTFEAERDLVGDGRLAQLELGIVEHDADGPRHLPDRCRRRILARHDDRALDVRREQLRDDPVEGQGQGRLAGPVQADDADRLSSPDAKVHAAERRRVGSRVRDAQVDDRDDRGVGHRDRRICAFSPGCGTTGDPR